MPWRGSSRAALFASIRSTQWRSLPRKGRRRTSFPPVRRNSSYSTGNKRSRSLSSPPLQARRIAVTSVPVALAYGWLRSVDDQDKFRLRLELWPQNRAVLYEGRGGLPTRTSGPRRTLAYCGQKFTNKRYITMIRSRRAVQVLLLTGIIASGAFAAPIAYNINFTTKY
jgi:hypothetical protein